MAHCINIKHPDYINLIEDLRAKESQLSELEIKARISVWQDINNTFVIPSIDDVEGIHNVAIDIQDDSNYSHNKDIENAINKKLSIDKFFNSNSISGIRNMFNNNKLTLDKLQKLANELSENKNSLVNDNWKVVLPMLLDNNEVSKLYNILVKKEFTNNENSISEIINAIEKYNINPVVINLSDNQHKFVENIINRITDIANLFQDPYNQKLIYDWINNIGYNTGTKKLDESKLKDSSTTMSAINRKLSSIFSAQDKKDSVNYIVEQFSAILDSYIEEHPNLSRLDILNKIASPSQIFKDIYIELENYKADLIESEDDQFIIDNVQKLIDNFWTMAMYSTTKLNRIEGLVFDINSLDTNDYDTSEGNDNGSSKNEGQVSNKEEKCLESWQYDDKHTSVISSLSQRVKMMISTLNDLSDEIDEDGNPIPAVNFIGTAKKMDASNVHVMLLDALKDIWSAKQMIPALRAKAANKPWMNIIADLIDNDHELFSQFYSNYRKDEHIYSLIKVRRLDNGTISMVRMGLNTNKEKDIRLERTKANLSTGSNGSLYAVYNNNIINKNNVSKILEIFNGNPSKKIKGLSSKWNIANGSLKTRTKFINENYVLIRQLLNGIGISIDSAELSDVLFDTIDPNNNRNSWSLDTILDKIYKIVNTLNNPSLTSVNDIFPHNMGNYTTLITTISQNLSALIENSVSEEGKSYYANLNPSYISKLIKKLKNSINNKEEFDKFIQEEFKQYDGTLYDSETGKFNISWLNQLLDENDGANNRNILEHNIMLNFDKSDYDSMSKEENACAMLANYFTGDETAYFHVPIMAEAPISRYIKFNKIVRNDTIEKTVNGRILLDANNKPVLDKVLNINRTKDAIVTELINTVFKHEYGRIKIIRGRQDLIKKDPTHKIEYLDDDRGLKFHFLDFLNDSLDEIDELVKDGNDVGLEKLLRNKISSYLNEGANNYIEALRSDGLLKLSGKKYIYLDSLGINQDNMNDKLHEYFYNSFLATANIIQLTSTDMAWFKHTVDFQKRNKQIHASGLPMNIYVEYNGERIGRDYERYVVLEDVKMPSTNDVLEAIKISLDRNEILSKYDKAKIYAAYGGSNYFEGSDSMYPPQTHNLTDGQSYRSIHSAKAIIAMSSGWNSKLESSFQNIIHNRYTSEDYNLVMEAFKLYSFNQRPVNSGVLKPNGQEKYLLKSVEQHKNSDTILLPVELSALKSEKIKGLMSAMYYKDKNGVWTGDRLDAIMFHSNVKIGAQGVIDISDKETSADIANHILSFENNKNVFKKIPFENVMIQQPTHDHLMDARSLIGTQIRMLSQADFNLDGDFKVGDTTMKGRDLRKLYNNILIENLIESYKDASGKFEDIHKLKDRLYSEILTNDRYNKDLLNYLELKGDKFQIPLFDETQKTRTEQMLNSIWKSIITKQKIKGGMVVQRSSYGYEDDLKVITENGAIKYMEVMIPFPSNKMPAGQNGFTKDGVHMSPQEMIDKGIIDEKFLEGIAYRMPTENKYSMIPFKVVGWLPKSAGGNIIMPREITTLTGCDFDIDKMYLMLNEFDFKTDYDFKGAKRKFLDISPEYINALNNKANPDYEIANKDYNEWLKNNKKDFIVKQYFQSINYDIKKNVEDMKLEERNNLLIDLMKTMISDPNNSINQWNPGGFDEHKKTSRILNLLATGKYQLNDIKNKNIEELDKLTEKINLNMCNPLTQLYFHNQNMIAARLIGMIANHSKNHALRSTFENKMFVKKYSSSQGRFFINGNSYTVLGNILSPDGKRYISRDYSEFLASAVDAVKDPVLSSLNMNEYTVNEAMFLCGLGYNSLEIGLLLRQPIIEECVKWYNEHANEMPSKKDAIEAVLERLEKYLSLNSKEKDKFSKYVLSQNQTFSRNWLASNINKKAAGSKELNKEYYYGQYQVLLNYKNILEASQELTDFVGATRSDTDGGSNGPEYLDTYCIKQRIEDIQDKIANGKNIIDGMDFMLDVNKIDLLDAFNDYKNKDRINEGRTNLRNSPLGFLQSFITFSVHGSMKAMNKYYPYTNPVYEKIFKSVKNQMASTIVSKKIMKQLWSEFTGYWMSNIPALQYDEKFFKEFPSKYNSYINSKDNEDIQELKLFKQITFQGKSDKNPISRLFFNSSGKLHNELRDDLFMEWEGLLFSPKHHDFAINLFRYNYFINGLAFSPTSFIHIAPAMVKLGIDKYVDRMYDLMDVDIDQKEIDTFLNQFFRNHLYNQSLIKQWDIASKDIQVYDTVTSLDGKVKENIYASKISNFPGIIKPDESITRYFENHGKFYNIVDIDETNNLVEFKEVKPLSIKNYSLAYDYNNDDFNTSLGIVTSEDKEGSSERQLQDTSKPQSANDANDVVSSNEGSRPKVDNKLSQNKPTAQEEVTLRVIRMQLLNGFELTELGKDAQELANRFPELVTINKPTISTQISNSTQQEDLINKRKAAYDKLRGGYTIGRLSAKEQELINMPDNEFNEMINQLNQSQHNKLNSNTETHINKDIFQSIRDVFKNGNAYDLSLVVLVDVIEKYINKNNIDVIIRNSTSDNDAGGASMISVTGENQYTIDINKNQSKKKIYEDLLHELVHVVTITASDYENGRINDIISTLHTLYVNKLKTHPKWNTYQRDYWDFKNKKVDRAYLENKYSEAELSIFHGSEDVTEFLASYVSNKNVRNVIDGILPKEAKTLLEELLNFINNIIKRLFDGHPAINSELVINHIREFILSDIDKYVSPGDLMASRGVSQISEDPAVRNINLDLGIDIRNPMSENKKYDIFKWIKQINNRHGIKLSVTYNNTTSRFDLKRDGIIINPIKESQFKLSGKDRINENNKQVYNSLRQQIIDILSKLGVGVGVLSEFEEKYRIDNTYVNGVFDPNGMKNLATNLIEFIKISNGEQGTVALPEEFAHFISSVTNAVNDPLHKRLTDLFFNNENLIEQVFEQDEDGSYEVYKNLYRGNKERLAAEARDKLIAKHIVQNEEIKSESLWASILRYLRDKIRSWFSNSDTSELQKTLREADDLAKQFSLDTMNGIVDITLNLDNLEMKNVMLNATSNLSRVQRIVEDAKNAELKRNKIERSKFNKNEIDISRRRIFIDTLTNLINDNRYNDALIKTGESMINEMNIIMKRVSDLSYDIGKNYNSDYVRRAAVILRELNGYIKSYTPIIEDMLRYINSNEFDGSESFEGLVNQLNTILKKGSLQYEDIAFPLFRAFIRKFAEPMMGLTINGEIINEEYIDNLLHEAQNDIGFFDKWAYSMSNSSDILLRLIEQPIKDRKSAMMDKVWFYTDKIQKAHEDLEKAGYKNTNFSYAKKDGEYTGFILNPINWEAYFDAKKKLEVQLLNKYGARNSQYWKELDSWVEKNTNLEDGITRPKQELWPNPEYDKLSTAQKDYLNKIIAIKRELDKLLPRDRVKSMLAPQVRKDLWERAKESKNMKQALHNLSESVSESFHKKEDEDEFGDESLSKMSSSFVEDYDGEIHRQLPIYYVNEIKDKSQLSTDLTSSMALYAKMALQYDAMNEVVDIMEIGSDILKERKITKTKGGKAVSEKIYEGGRWIENKIYKRKHSSNFFEKLDEWMNMQVYGEMTEDQVLDVFGLFELDVNKAAANLMKLTAMNTYAFNLLGGVSNIAIGKSMERIEAIGGQWFKMKDLRAADLQYSKWLPDVIKEIGQRRSTTYAGLMIRKFNVMQNFEESIRGIEMNRKNIVTRLFKSSSAFFLQNCGEHYLQTRTFLALAQNIKLLQSGNEINLLEAFEIIKNSDGIEKLVLKECVTKLDGTKFTDDDIHRISRRSAKINQDMHGIYNHEDRSLMQKYAMGKMLIMFRKWIPTAISRRYAKENFNFDSESVEEGFYNTAFKFLRTLWKDVKDGQGLLQSWSKEYEELTGIKQANIKKAIAEIATFLILVLAGALLRGLWDDDDDDGFSKWAKSFALYQIRRLQAEQGVLTTPIGAASETLNILRSPSAVINYIQDVMTAIIRVDQFFAEPLQSGPYKGWNKGVRNYYDILPYTKPIKRAFSPDQAIKFYNLGGYK